jgi:hypothetical protein
MCEKVIRDMVDAVVNKLYSLDYKILKEVDDVCKFSKHFVNSVNLGLALKLRDWEYVKEAYVETAISLIIHDIRCAKSDGKPITDEDKNKMVKMFTDVLSIHEYEKFAKYIIEDVERLMAIVLEVIRK